MNGMFLIQLFLHFIHSGCCMTFRFACGKTMVAIIHLFPNDNHLLSKLGLMGAKVSLDVTETRKSLLRMLMMQIEKKEFMAV